MHLHPALHHPGCKGISGDKEEKGARMRVLGLHFNWPG